MSIVCIYRRLPATRGGQSLYPRHDKSYILVQLFQSKVLIISCCCCWCFWCVFCCCIFLGHRVRRTASGLPGSPSAPVIALLLLGLPSFRFPAVVVVPSERGVFFSVFFFFSVFVSSFLFKFSLSLHLAANWNR